MDLGISEELKDIREKIRAFVYEKVTPVEQEYMKEIGVDDRWSHTPRQDEILNNLIPYGIDISSGVEEKPGIKSTTKINNLIENTLYE